MKKRRVGSKRAPKIAQAPAQVIERKLGLAFRPEGRCKPFPGYLPTEAKSQERQKPVGCARAQTGKRSASHRDVHGAEKSDFYRRRLFRHRFSKRLAWSGYRSIRAFWRTF